MRLMVKDRLSSKAYYQQYKNNGEKVYYDKFIPKIPKMHKCGY